MKKQTWYWIIGIAAVIIVIIIWASLSGRRSNNNNQTQEQTTTNAMESTSLTGHEGMNHGTQAQSADTDLAGYLEEQDTIMANMMADMKNIPESKNASIDFLHGMIPHHESAVEMAESYLKHGPNHEDLIQLAKDIIDQQTGEIDQMKSMIEELTAANLINEENEAAYLKEYNKMFSEDNSHSHHIDSSNVKNVDAAFAQGMIMHHQMALDMAKGILPYTEDEKVKELAQNIIDLQEKEIKQMEDILNGI